MNLPLKNTGRNYYYPQTMKDGRSLGVILLILSPSVDVLKNLASILRWQKDWLKNYTMMNCEFMCLRRRFGQLDISKIMHEHCEWLKSSFLLLRHYTRRMIKPINISPSP